MQPDSSIEQDPLRWRLEYKAALLTENLSPATLLEMSREGIRTIKSHAPNFERIRNYGAGIYYVPMHELSDLDRAQAELKQDLAGDGRQPYDAYIDHVIDVQSLMVRMTAAMERFSDDHKDQVAAIEAAESGRGCLVAGLFLGSGLTAATITGLIIML